MSLAFTAKGFTHLESSSSDLGNGSSSTGHSSLTSSCFTYISSTAVMMASGRASEDSEMNEQAKRPPHVVASLSDP